MKGSGTVGLGLRLAVNGGREAVTRLVILAVAVGLGVGLLLTAVANTATNRRVTFGRTGRTPLRVHGQGLAVFALGVGVTSGASVPEELVTGVLGKLAALGFADVEEIEAVKERMSFQLPRELRK